MIKAKNESGYTIVELVIALFVIAIVALSTLQLFTALVNSALVAKKKSVALSLATNQMEYLKSLPYNNLAVAGGSIVANNPLPASVDINNSGFNYKVETAINYSDDAFDGCGSYPNTQLKQQYCRNYPPPSNMASVTDSNAADYKVVNVRVKSQSGDVLADIDTQIAARVAETASNTGAMFVKVIDSNGNPIIGATAHVVNSTTTPSVDVSDTTDSNGMAIFYGLPPDTGADYRVDASLSGYSSLSTIASSGSLVATYPNLQLLSQSSSYSTLQLKPMTANSLVVEAVDTNGNPLGNMRIYIKGGYKRYTSTSNTAYYYDNLTPSDSRLVTDGGGLGAVSNLAPGSYYFCGDTGSTSCSVGGTSYYLVSALPYVGASPFSPIQIPTYIASSPPTTLFSYAGSDYIQKVRLVFATSSSAPRVSSVSPYEANQSSSNMSAFDFQIKGTNLPCSSNPSSCATTVRLLQGSSTYTASCTGNFSGVQLNCTVNISSASLGWTSLQISASGHTVTMPASPPYGGINVTP